MTVSAWTASVMGTVAAKTAAQPVCNVQHAAASQILSRMYLLYSCSVRRWQHALPPCPCGQLARLASIRAPCLRGGCAFGRRWVRFSEADSSSITIEIWNNRLQAGSRGGAATEGREAKAGAHEAKAGAHADDKAGSGATANASEELPEGDEVPRFSPKLSKTFSSRSCLSWRLGRKQERRGARGGCLCPRNSGTGATLLGGREQLAPGGA